ncbi:cysteine desulfurase family protein [Haloferula sp.]|uniref:cysteine desulfurase family protein n=1 Tax=Haloferula sp. TaxID=2497595 RepID=UPI003C73266C
MIYLDNNSTTRVLPDILDAMLPYFSTAFFNTTTLAGALYDVARPLSEARERVAELIDCSAEEIILTSGATESNNWVLQSIARHSLRQTGKCHLVVSAIEHPSVLQVASYLAETEGRVEVDLAPVSCEGVIDLAALRDLIRPDTALVSVMLANNETGVIQPVAEAAALAKEINQDCLVHSDATQAVGKITLSLNDNLRDVDFLSLSGHKFHGPKGIGALFIRSGVDLAPYLYGGGQQGGARPGTENPALAAGIAKAAEIATMHLDDRRLESLRSSLEAALCALGVTVLGGGARRLPNTSLLLFEDLDSEMLIHRLAEADFATSSGSACTSGSDSPSHVVLAMGINYSSASGALRISLSHETTQNEVSEFIDVLKPLAQSLKKP